MEITVKYPESWKDIKYSQYIKYHKMLKPYEGLSTYQKKNLELAALHFCDVPTDLLYLLPKDTFEKISLAINNLANLGKQPLTKTFEIENTKYGFIPSLDEMSYGEYLDLVEYFKDATEYAPIILSILYRPIVKEFNDLYTIESYSGTHPNKIELFTHVLTMDIVFGAISFFLDLQKDLMNATLTYSMEMMKKLKDPKDIAVLQDLQKNGVDIAQLQSSLKMMLQNLTQ
jgi:hypothetical protein